MSRPMFTCQELVELVSDYLDGTLPDHERARFEAHLELCDPCVRYVEQMRETIRLTGTLTEEQLPRSERAAILAAFRELRRT
jgi:anti-sigma factor RsiW